MTKTLNINGTEVYVNGSGNSTIIMIHGWPDTHEIWNKQVAFFKQSYTCVTFTLPGFDKNNSGKYSLDDTVQRIKEITDAVSPDAKAIFFVHDWGCIYGYEFAMRFPERIQKMVAIDVGDANGPEFEKTLSLKAKGMIFMYQFTLALGWLTKSDFIHKTMAKGLTARSNFDNIHAGMGLPYAMRWLGVAGGLDKVKQIKPTFPFFYIYGLKKPFFFQTENWLQELQKNQANKVMAFNSGHWVMVDKADQFNTEVAAWLQV